MDPASVQKKSESLGLLPKAGDAEDRDEGTGEVVCWGGSDLGCATMQLPAAAGKPDRRVLALLCCMKRACEIIFKVVS